MALIVFGQTARLISSSSLVLLRKINGVSATVKFAPDGVSTYIIYTSSFHNSVVESEFKLANIMIPSTVGVVATP